MFGLLRGDQPAIAAVYFPGIAPPPADAFGRLRDQGYRLSEQPAGEFLWRLALEHPVLGQAELACEREATPIDDLIAFANNVTDRERADARGASSHVLLRVPANRRNLLRDRKTMLRIARDVLGGDGLMVIDTASQLPWSRASLADELAHDADLDVEALYCLHAVAPDDPTDDAAPDWIHTHGLGELGAFDLDIVAPHRDFAAQCGEPFRGLASIVLDQGVRPDTARFGFGQPGGEARLVPAERFMREADPSFTSLRAAPDHDEHRSVLCEPAGRGLFGFGRSDRPEPLRFARRPPPEQFVAFLPDSMTETMAERARATVDVLRRLRDEFAEFEPAALVKLGYPTGQGGREHLWFSVHGIGESTVDATLENKPFYVDLRAGERAERPLELLTDWTLLTPAGPIDPRSQAAARRLRESADEIRASMAN